MTPAHPNERAYALVDAYIDTLKDTQRMRAQALAVCLERVLRLNSETGCDGSAYKAAVYHLIDKCPNASFHMFRSGLDYVKTATDRADT
jgi:hypothetical protein